jgi:hypothetical protein
MMRFFKPKEPIKELLDDQKRERSSAQRLYRKIGFVFGYSKCRYCIHIETTGHAQGAVNHQSTRESFLMNSAKCGLGKGLSSSHLDYDEIRAWNRCPGFSEALYNFKGIVFDKSEMERIRERQRSGMDILLKWLGWIVALAALLWNWQNNR